MLSADETKALVAKLLRLCPKPTAELHRRSELSRATVNKFLSGGSLREANLQKLLNVATKMIEERQKLRNDILEQQKRIKEGEVDYDLVSNEIKNK